jgi:FHA domain-containing protein
VIKLDVHDFNGRALPQPLSATLDELGGKVGRADGNQLVLPDPERTVSRVHAEVVFRNGAYAVIDRGSNPISINDRPLGNGQSATLKTGDELQIGGYGIRVTVLAAQRSSPASGSAGRDPFAEFGLGAPAPAPAARGAAWPAAATAASSSVDPLAAFGVSPAAPQPPAANRPAASGGIPDDWDPFGNDKPSGPPAWRAPPSSGGGGGNDFGLEVHGAAPAPLVSGLQMGGNAADSSLDALFGLGAASGADPLANSLLDAPVAQPNMASHSDPVRSLNSATRGTAESAPDQLSELNRPFVSPGGPRAQPAAAPRAGDGAGRVAGEGAQSGPQQQNPRPAVLSWEEESSPRRTVIQHRPSASAGAAPAAPAPAVTAGRMPAAAASAPAPASPADMDVMTRALCEGLGMSALPGGRLTPETLRLVGELLHEATRGTVELLIARAALKREVRAEVTKIVARENNPLKFSPNVEVALAHLLGPETRGFIAPAPAMRDAYDDLRAHQFGFLAGMRAALEGVLKRFDPAVLEGKLTQTSMLAKLLPSTRKAQMWDVFQQLYAQISAEAADDFHELFGREFLRAYEAHIDELKKEPR